MPTLNQKQMRGKKFKKNIYYIFRCPLSIDENYFFPPVNKIKHSIATGVDLRFGRDSSSGPNPIPTGFVITIIIIYSFPLSQLLNSKILFGSFCVVCPKKINKEKPVDEMTSNNV